MTNVSVIFLKQFFIASWRNKDDPFYQFDGDILIKIKSYREVESFFETFY